MPKKFMPAPPNAYAPHRHTRARAHTQTHTRARACAHTDDTMRCLDWGPKTSSSRWSHQHSLKFGSMYLRGRMHLFM